MMRRKTSIVGLALLIVLVLALVFGIKPGSIPVDVILIIMSVIAAIAASAAVPIARRWLDKKTFLSLGLRWDTQAGKDLFFGFILKNYSLIIL